MKRLVMMTIIKMLAEAILFAILVGGVIVAIGSLNKWNNSLVYSNAFFIGGCLMIVTGGLSRMAAGQSWNNLLLPHTESFRDMSSSERANLIIQASSSVRLLILGLLSGILLIFISLFLPKMF
jgi:hypothetical protein